MKKRLLFLALSISGFISSIQAQQTVLTKGDIVIIGMASATQYDEFSWIPLVDIAEGTKIYFTDAGYDRDFSRFLGINPVTSASLAIEGLYRYTAPSGGLARGTIVTMTENNSPANYVALNTSGTKFGADTALTIGNSGDQITVFQSTDNDTTSSFGTTNITVIYTATLSTTDFSTYHYNASQSLEFDKATNLHPQLDHVDGVPNSYVAVGVASGWIDESDSARYEGVPLSGTKNEILTLVSTASNWKRYNAPPVSSPDGSQYSVNIPTAASWTTNGMTNANVTVPDTTPPTVAITSTSNASINSSSFPIIVTLSESVIDFAAGDITVGNGTLSNFSGSGTTYTATVTPTAEGTVTVDVAAGVAHDAASNGNTVATQLSRIYDVTRPTATITTTTTSPTNTTGITFTITFSEPVTGFSLIDNLPSNATIYAFSGSGTTYTLKMDPASNGTSSFSIPANGATDAAGNTNTATSAYNIVYDTVQPTVAITSTVSNPTSAATFPVTITFSESVTGFDISDITATNANVSNFSGSGAVYTADISSTLVGSGTIAVNVGAAKAIDGAGNANTAAPTFTVSYIAACSSARIWIGSWIGGLPVADQPVVFLTDYTATSNLAACSLQINSPAKVTFPSGYNLTVSGNMLINSGAQLIMENNANLIQGGTGNANVGSGVTIKRNAFMRRLDYVYWSSPVEGQGLQTFSPSTISTRFYTMNEQTNAFETADPANSFSLAKGYLVRAPDNFLNAPAAPQLFTGSFTGRPNNGTISIPVTTLGAGYNLIGNPYASTINADLFLADPANQNIEALYFWAHINGIAGGTNYATYNATGAAGAAPSDTDPASETPNGFIQVGQAFVAQVTSTGNATFKNSMRAANNSNQFFRTADTVEKNRIWLNLTNTNGGLNQALVGYVTDATNGLDTKFDGKLMETEGTRLYNLINDSEYAIQGRALPFADTDVVALGFKAAAAGTFTISIDHIDGLFLNDQDIFLKDNLTGSINNLKQNAYTFASEQGTFNSRFEVVYQNTTLGIDNPVLNADSIVVYKQNNTLNINAGNIEMANVKIFDIRGRLIFERNNINTNTTAVSDLGAAQQVLVLQITTTDNKTISKKVVY